MQGKVSVKLETSQVIEQSGSDFAVYPIAVKRQNVEGSSSGWTVYRRYSQFLTLHLDLKNKFPHLMQNYDLPGKLFSGIMKKRAAFLETRREALETYLTV